MSRFCLFPPLPCAAVISLMSGKSLVISPEIRIPKLPSPAGIVFLKVVDCKSCKHTNAEPNPLLEEVRTDPKLQGEGWPWQYGDCTLPEGRECAICPFAHRVGGYAESFDKLMERCKKNTDACIEWYGVVKFSVEMLNRQKIKYKCTLRGPARDSMTMLFDQVRKRSVQLQRSFKLKVTQRNTGLPVDIWKERHDGKDPVAAGRMVVPVFIQGQGTVDHVVTRKGDQHEVDIDFEQATGVSLFELLDDGSLTSRSGQQTDVFNLAVQGTIWEWPQHPGKEPKLPLDLLWQTRALLLCRLRRQRMPSMNPRRRKPLQLRCHRWDLVSWACFVEHGL